MTREEAIKILKAIRVYECYPKSASEETKEAIDMAIEALSAEAEEYEDYEHATLVDIKAPLRASAEAVEVVRCKDCKHQEECEQIVVFDIHVASVQGHRVDSCSYGERREP